MSAGTTPSEDIRNNVARIKKLLGLDVERLGIASDIEGVITGGPFGPIDFTTQGVSTTSYVNVSTSLGPAQGGAPSPPVQIAGLNVIVVGSNQLDLTWTASSDPFLINYNIYRSTVSGAEVLLTTSGVNSFSDTTVNPSTTYYYKVAAVNSAGAGTLSIEDSATTPAVTDITPPGQTVGLNAIAVSTTQINLTWIASTAPDINHYNVHRATTTGFTPGIGNQISQPATNAYNNTGLTPSTTYFYKITAVDNTGNIGTPSIEDSATTQAVADTTPPNQTVGLVANVISTTQINLTWTSSTAIDLDHYNVHRSTISGFTPGIGNQISQPTTNSYNNTGLTAGTTYYYKVTAVDATGNIGTASLEDSATTQTTPPAVSPTLWLRFDGDYSDSSINDFHYNNASNVNGFVTPGKFGPDALFLNTPVTPAAKDNMLFTNDPAYSIAGSTAFSISLWVYPTDLTTGSDRRQIISKRDDANNVWYIQFDSAGVCYFHVKKAGVEYKRQISGFTLNNWQHIGAVFTGSSVALYRNAVTGVASVAASAYTTDPNSWLYLGSRPDSPNTTYWEGRIDEVQYYQVALSQSDITSLMNTNQVSSAPDTTPPGQTMQLVATSISSSQINLTWTASVASDINHYNVHRSTTSGFTPAIGNQISQPTTNAYNNTGLSASTTYFYKVTAVDTTGNIGIASAQASATTPAVTDTTPPGQTVQLVANVISSSQINLTWTASTAIDLNHYDVHRATTTGFTPSAGNRIASPTTASYNNTGLASSTTYYYKVTAVDNTGNIGTPSVQASGTTTAGADVTPPGQTVQLVATTVSGTQINLAWTASTAPDINHYNVHRSTTSGFTPAAGNQISQPTTNSYNNTGLTAGTTYFYKVAAVDATGNIGTPSAQASATTTDTTPPGQTMQLVATVVSGSQINLSWTASTATDLNHYDVHRATTSGFTPAAGNRIFQPTTNSYNNTGLAAGTTYYYKVAAVDDSANIGAYSAQVIGTTSSTLDPFGITKLHATKSGGRVWNSNWHTATSHSWSPASQEPGNEDPQDSMADLICPSFCKAVVDSTTDTMTCDSNATPTKASFRMYIKDPGCTPSSSPWKWSPNVEITIYYKALNLMAAGTIHVHARLIGPSEHWNAITDENPTACKAAGHDYAFEIKDNGTIQLRKEQVHLETTPDGYAIDVVSATNSAPFNTWIGMKLICQKQGANMKVEGWRDTTDGASGGTWVKVVEKLDTGSNWKLDPASVSPFNALPAGSGNCTKINPMDRILDMTASACGLRVDNTKVQFKKFSIREIDFI